MQNQPNSIDSAGEFSPFQPEIKFVKTHEDAQLPFSKNDNPLTGDSGRDLYAVEPYIIEPGGSEVVNVGLQLAYITPGYWFRIEARSGLGFKHGIQPHFGIVDNEYTGDLSVKLYNISRQPYHITKGDRIAQIVVYPLIQPIVSWADEVNETSRGASGFGSSGK